jgi:hypothetical protein
VAEVVTSDSFSVVRKVLKESERNQREQEQVQREHEKEILAMDKQSEAEKLQAERDHELLKQDNELANRLKVTHIQSAARVNDRNEEEGDMEAVNEAAQRYINDGVKNQNETRKVDLKEQDQNSKEKLAMQQLRLKTEDLKLKKESNQIKKQAIKAKTFGDIINKN